MAYTGNGTANHTIPHHLGSTPEMFWVKIRSGDNNNWGVYHHKSNANPEQYALYLDGNASATDDGFLNDVGPTSSVINLSGGNYGNVNTNTYVAHCWSEVQGFSKMFTFKGNGSTDGTYVHLGFSPELIIWKNATTSNLQGWWMADAKRDTYNVADNNLRPSGTGGESESYDMFDFTSNGFKVRWDDDAINDSGETFVGMAFAKAPCVNSSGVPANAR